MIFMTWLVRLSTAGFQLMLVRPIGQVACFRCQSMPKRAASKPCPDRAIWYVSQLRNRVCGSKGLSG